MISIVMYHESHYVGVLENPQIIIKIVLTCERRYKLVACK